VPFFTVYDNLVDLIQEEFLDSRNPVQNRAAFLQKARTAIRRQDLHRSIFAEVFIVIDRIYYAPGVFAFHFFGGNGYFNRPATGHPDGHLQGTVAVLGASNIIIKTILVEVTAEVFINLGKQAVTGILIIFPDNHAKANDVIDRRKIFQRSSACAGHTLQFIPSLPVAIDRKAH